MSTVQALIPTSNLIIIKPRIVPKPIQNHPKNDSTSPQHRFRIVPNSIQNRPDVDSESSNTILQLFAIFNIFVFVIIIITPHICQILCHYVILYYTILRYDTSVRRYDTSVRQYDLLVTKRRYVGTIRWYDTSVRYVGTSVQRYGTSVRRTIRRYETSVRRYDPVRYVGASVRCVGTQYDTSVYSVQCTR